MKTLLVLGHSFVRRVADKIDKDSLDLGGDIDNIAVRGFGGMRVSGVYRQLSYVRRIKPYVIFLDIGTNDLSDPQKDPVELAREVIVAARTIGEVPGVRTVIISEVMMRADGRWHNFNNVRFILNDELKRLATSYDNIYMCNHRGFATRWRDHLRPEGVHLTARGTLLYLKNMRYAVRKYGLKLKHKTEAGHCETVVQCRYCWPPHTSTTRVTLFINT